MSGARLLECLLACWLTGLRLLADAAWDQEEQKPTLLTSNVGEHVVFNCELDFPQDIPIPYILKWYKDGQSVFSWYDGQLSATEPFVGRINLVDIEGYGKGSVNLTSIRESDFGWFQCRVLFPNRNPSSRNNGTWFYLTVNGGNLLEIPPINHTAMEGEEVKFHCITKDRNTRVTWYKDSISIRELTDLISRSWVSDEGTLTIRSTTMSDLGEYECEAVDPSGERQAARAYLDVQYKAKVVYTPKEVFLPYGRPAVLDCHFRSNPALTTLRWEKDGFLFDPYNVQGVFYKRNGSLFFSKVDETHAGQYSCTPYNKLGSDGPSPAMRVVVQRPPVFVVTPNTLYLRRLGDDVTFPCDARDADSTHKPTIIWYKKDGIPLPDGRHEIHQGNLTIKNVHEEDRGFYQCSAFNEAATITTDSELMIENVAPRTPYNITADPTENSVHIKWTSGYDKPHQEYSVWYRPAETVEWRTIKLDTNKNSEATISNLTPGREYEFMVLSQDKHGDGMISKSIKVKTKGTEYYNSPEKIKENEESLSKVGPPRNVTVQMAMDGYLVTWEPPEHGKELVRLYVVRWSQGSMEHLLGTAETRDLYYNVDECKNKWTLLRSYYKRALNKKKTISGQAAKKQKKWRCETEINFLLNYLQDREQQTSLDESLVDNTDTQEELSDQPVNDIPLPALDTSTPTPPLVSKKRNNDSSDELAEKLGEFVQFISKKQDEDSEKNELMVFFEDIAQSMSKFPIADRLEMKKDIFNLVNNRELEILNKTNTESNDLSDFM